MPFDTPLIIPLLDGELTSAFGLFFYFWKVKKSFKHTFIVCQYIRGIIEPVSKEILVFCNTKYPFGYGLDYSPARLANLQVCLGDFFPFFT